MALIATIKFGLELKPKLGTGMTGFDTTWYHGPFAAGFFQSGDTWALHFIAPQFLAWFYPANSEVFHAVGMLAFERDLLSPLLNLGWFLGCLLACWCIGRPHGVAPWSLALGAVALSLPAFADQAGEARNDIVGAFFLLAAVAILLARRDARGAPAGGAGAALVAGLAIGMAAGTKLNFLLPAAVLVAGAALLAAPGRRPPTLLAGVAGAALGGGYWYLRNLAHAGNPLPWIGDLGPLSLPAPDQELGGRDDHSVVGYLSDGAVWSDWLLPGLRDGLTALWPLLLAAALAGLLLAALALRRSSRLSPASGDNLDDPRPRGGDRRVLGLAGLVGLATVIAWLVAPTSASGPAGEPRGFESGLRYLIPALTLGLALLPAAPPLRARLARLASLPAPWSSRLSTVRGGNLDDPRGGREYAGPPALAWAAAGLLAVVALAGYPVQRHYMEGRYADPSFTTPGLNAAFAELRDSSGVAIATTSTRQYPLFGADLSNRVEFVGEERPHGGFVAPADCRAWRRLLADGDFTFVVTSRDRIEPGAPPFPPEAAWTAGPGAEIVLEQPPTIVYRLDKRPNPSVC